MDNNIFSFERFLKVLKYDLKFRVPAFFPTFAVLLVVVHIVHFMFDFNGSFSIDSRTGLMQALLFFCAFYAPFAIYSKINGKKKGTEFLMLPASSLEKFASMFLITVVVVPVAYLLCSWLLDSLLVLVFKDTYAGFISLHNMELSQISLAVFCAVSTSLYGNLLFRKGAMSKTILCVLAVTLLWSSAASWSMFEELIEMGADAEKMESRLSGFVNLTRIVYLTATLVLYALAYLRIRKIQIS